MNKQPEYTYFSCTESEPPMVGPEMIPGWILEDHERYIAINKPAGLVCHPSKNGPWSSLAGALKEYFGWERVHLLHRLDRETSGICLFGKDRGFAREVQMAFEAGKTQKEYLALLEGEMTDSMTCKGWLSPDKESLIAVKLRHHQQGGGKPAETLFEPLKITRGRTLCRVIPLTGRKHQIRIHAQALGYPIVGEKLYGQDESLYLDFVTSGWGPRHAELLGTATRQMLHAWKLEVPFAGQSLRWEAPVVPDMQREMESGL